AAGARARRRASHRRGPAHDAGGARPGAAGRGPAGAARDPGAGAVARGAAERGEVARGAEAQQGAGMGGQRGRVAAVAGRPVRLRIGHTGAGAAPRQGAGAADRVEQRRATHLAPVLRAGAGAGAGAGEGGAVNARTSQQRLALALALRQSCELRQSWGAPFSVWLARVAALLRQALGTGDDPLDMAVVLAACRTEIRAAWDWDL